MAVRRTITNTGPLGVYDAGLGRNLTYGDLTPHTGSLNLATPGTTYRRVLFSETPVIAANNVTIDQCLVRPPNNVTYCVGWKAVSGSPPVGLQIIDTEIDGQGTDGPSGSAPSASLQPGINYTMRRGRLRGTRDGLKPQDNPADGAILIEDCLIHAQSFPGASHTDSLQIAGTGAHDVTVRGCTTEGYRPDLTPPMWVSSSLMQWGSFPKNPDGTNKGVLRDILIDDCYIDGGTYASRVGQLSTAVCQNVVIRGCKFGLNHEFGTLTAGSGELASDGGFVHLENNTWDVTGTTLYGLAVVAGEPVIAGQLITAPDPTEIPDQPQGETMPLTTPGSVTFALVDAAGNAIVDVTPTVPVGHAVVVDAFGNATVTGPPGEGYVLTVGARTVPYVIPAAASEVEAIKTTASDAAASAAANVTALSGKAALDLSNVTASVGRTALGLGTAATANTGTGATNTILGNDARLADQRVPTDGSVSTAKVIDGAVTLPKTSAAVQASLAAADAAAPKVRTVTAAYAATVTPNADATDVLNVGALTGPLTLATPTGTPRDGQTLRVRFEQDATGGRVVTFGAGFAFGTDVTTALVPATASAKWVQMFAYDATTAKWRALAIARGF